MVKGYPQIIQLIANFTITSLQVRIYTDLVLTLEQHRGLALVLCGGCEEVLMLVFT